jgi:hypothetical protein
MLRIWSLFGFLSWAAIKRLPRRKRKQKLAAYAPLIKSVDESGSGGRNA